MESIIIKHDRIYVSIGLYILLVSAPRILFFAIFFREPPKVPTKK